MKFNWKPDTVAFLDFETQSAVDLKTSTVHKYATDQSTRALTCVVRVDGKSHRFGPYFTDQDKERLLKVTDGRTIVAHNAPFDGAIWEHCLGLPEAEWFDTLKTSRAGGLPGMLDRLGYVLEGRGKDPNGKRLIDLLCCLKPGRPAPVVGPAHRLLMEYNERDVELLETVYHKTKPYIEPEVMTVDYTINQRGIPINRERLEHIADLAEYFSRTSKDEFIKTTGALPSSPKQVIEWLAKKGFDVSSVNKPAVAALFKDPDKFYVDENLGALDVALEEVRDALQLRKESVSVGLGKSLAAISVLDADDRMREQLVYWGAHTGRWTGRRFQVHNLPSVVGHGADTKTIEPTKEAVMSVAEHEKVTASNVCGVMLRTVVQSDNLLVADYAAVEMRGTAWCVEEETMLKLYSDPDQSLYIDMGRRIFGKKLDKVQDFDAYQLAKAVILGCGYGMSGAKFDYQLTLRDVNRKPLDDAGLTPAALVKMYREAYPAIPGGWWKFNDAVHMAVKGSSNESCKCKFYMSGNDLHAELPSGRCLIYRNARIEMLVPSYCALYGMPEIPKPTVVYDNPRGYRGYLYGSKVCENIVQALCRDFLATALVKCEQAGLNPVLHVHDEVVCEAPPSKFRLFMEIMSEQPPWAKGFPILVEGYSGPVWSKQPKGYEQLAAMNGKVLEHG